MTAVSLTRPPHPLVSLQLANGTVLHVQGVTYGAEHHWFHGSVLQQWLLPIAPPSMARRIGGHGYEHTASSRNALVVWAAPHSPPGARPASSDCMAVVMNERGQQIATASVCATMSREGGASRVLAWELPTFPRRGRTVTVWFEDRTDYPRRTSIGDLTFPNPDHGRHPELTPEPLPASRSTGRTRFTLTGLETGRSRADPSRAAAPGERAWSRLLLRAEEGERPAPWLPVQVTATDATGNQWSTREIVPWPGAPGDAGCLIGAGLPVEERAYRLKLVLARTGRYSSAEQWTPPPVRLPQEGESLHLSHKASRQGAAVKLRAVLGRHTPWRVPGYGTFLSGAHIWAYLEVKSAPPGLRVELLRAVDERERPIGSAPLNSVGNGFMVQLRPRAGTRTARLIFAVHRSRTVEFLAPPAE